MNAAVDQQLEVLLGDLHPDDFFERFWETEPCLLDRFEPDRYSHLLSLDDVDRILTAGTQHFPLVRLFKGGSPVPPESYTRSFTRSGFTSTDLIDLERVLAAFCDGATVVVRALDRSHPPLRRLCAELSRYLLARVSANAYLTPRDSQGLRPHFDPHGVFVLQLAGAKSWQVFGEAIRFPLDARASPGLLEQAQAVLQLETVLRPGGFLYIPRGVVHNASTADEPSLHLTVGIRAVVWSELFEELAQTARRDARFRRALPRALLDSGDQAELSAQFTELWNAFVQIIDPGAAVAAVAARVLGELESSFTGSFAEAFTDAHED